MSLATAGFGIERLAEADYNQISRGCLVLVVAARRERLLAVKSGHKKDSLRQALQELSDEHPQFRALYRYVNRESHADSVNLTDFGEIDPQVFVERFKDVFTKTKFEAHFDKMMA
ncbi:hypothetical protein ACQKIK_18420 [Pseudomonas sp. NPDC047961]